MLRMNVGGLNNMRYVYGFLRDSAIFVIISLLILCIIHIRGWLSKSVRAKIIMRVIAFLFVILLIAVIFVEGIMIIDQEARIDQMKSRVDETITEADNLINKLNTLIDTRLSTSTATSTVE